MSGCQPGYEMEPTSCLIEDFNRSDGQFRHFAPYSHPVTHTRIHSEPRPPCMQTLRQSKPLIVVSNSDSAGIQRRAAPYLPTCSNPQTHLFFSSFFFKPLQFRTERTVGNLECMSLTWVIFRDASSPEAGCGYTLSFIFYLFSVWMLL